MGDIEEGRTEVELNRIKKVVVVYGAAQTGKTTALCLLCEKLITKCPSKDMFALLKKGGKRRLSDMPRKKDGTYRDIRCAVRCKDNLGKEVLVGIGTAGDNGKTVIENFEFFSEAFTDKDSDCSSKYYDCVFIAIRKDNIREDSPLKALEQLESEGLNVLRPFKDAPNATKFPTKATLAQQEEFARNCRKCAEELETMI